ncbi:beta-N-acetylhexosaminidase [Actinoplanes sp. LDG1-06]|uniref:beta-N-acetylhexosaminidase n=1 Tax=Paractinoplanes ovalisporus TaxID=2810368 RepID=A0ABS2A7T9_9ACTN|nr:beta-N-acetylhexosaminidase [Actinoplanes ovalisporus]MBM2615914.1 beta-N-acetylhexosaminidase [Actinoplanes ovalisporus]
MRLRLAVLLACALPLTAAAAPAPVTPVIALGSVIPAPVQVHQSGPGFRITDRTVIIAPPRARDVADRLGEALRLRVAGHSSGRTGNIALELSRAITEPEGYRLTVNRSGITVRAASNAGLFNGVQTLQQLVPLTGPRTVAGGEIVDHPRFGYRGTMLDLARHFHTPAEVKRHIDEISKFKVNYLHLHLSDDQGWRIQIDSWPRLTTVGGGPGTGVDGVGPGYLTKADYRDLVRYAASRYVTIVPEIDMPGHVNAAQVAYPELTCDGVAPPPRTDTAVGYSSLCIGHENTYGFVEDVIRELAAMTPGPYIHIGGDEAHATTAADYLTFQKRVLPLVAKYGKTAYGWNEIAAAPEARTAVAQYWGLTTTNATLAAAVANGTRVIMSPANLAYIDQKYDPSTPLGLSWAGYIEVRKAYDWDPHTHVAGVPESAVLGVEAPLWSETLRDLDDIEFMAFPRLAGIAELGWSPSRDWESYRTRLGAYGPRWTARGVDFYRSPQIDWS